MEQQTTTAVVDPEDTIDFDARYRVASMPGVAFYLIGWARQWEPYTTFVDDPDDPDGEPIEVETCDGEWVPDYRFVRAVMVGDDREHLVDVDDLELLGEDEFCRSCGQTGCRWDVAEVA